MARSEPKALRGVLSQVARSLGLSDPAERTLHETWPRIVGERLASVCRVEELREGRLIVGVDHPAWRYELTMGRDELRRMVNERLREAGAAAGGEPVKDVVIRLRRRRDGA